jgi:hypothetical protein
MSLSSLLISKFAFPEEAAYYSIAVMGSIAVEIAALVRDTTASEGRIPQRYKSIFYIAARILFAIVCAGPLAFLLNEGNAGHTDLMSFYIGVSAPLIYDRMAAGALPKNGNASGGPNPSSSADDSQ